MAGKRTIAVVGHWRDRPNPEDDARLIAAAPDLLEALEECVALIRNTITTADDLHEIHNADKAIQKAKA